MRTACNVPRCPKYAVAGGRGRCAEHRQTTAQRGYGPEHQAQRQAELSTARCAGCGCTDNLQLDHIVPTSLGGTNARSNKRWLCRCPEHRCHDRLGARRDRHPDRVGGGVVTQLEVGVSRPSSEVSTQSVRSPKSTLGTLGRVKLTEADFRRQVVHLADIYGWDHVGFRAAMTQQGWRTAVTGTLGKGWPDLTLVRVRDRRLIFAELKARAGKTSPDQDRVLEVLRCLKSDGSPRVEVYVWREGEINAIAEVLR